MSPTNIFSLKVQAPFDWPSLLAFLRLRATPGVETVTDAAYSRTIILGSEPQTLSITYDATRGTLRIVHSGSAGSNALIETRVKQIFKIDTNTVPIETFLAPDPWLKSFVIRQPGLRVPGGWSPLEIALRAILGQQVSVPAATTLMGRLVRAAGMRLSETEWLFPTPKQIIASSLSDLGIPASRRETVKTMAAFFAENGDDCLSQENIQERLLTLKGIGRWTAGYILMRTGNNPDYWPEGDLVLRKAVSREGPMIAIAELERIFNHWSPYRSYATIHIWKGFMPVVANTSP